MDYHKQHYSKRQSHSTMDLTANKLHPTPINKSVLLVVKKGPDQGEVFPELNAVLTSTTPLNKPAVKSMIIMLATKLDEGVTVIVVKLLGGVYRPRCYSSQKMNAIAIKINWLLIDLGIIGIALIIRNRITIHRKSIEQHHHHKIRSCHRRSKAKSQTISAAATIIARIGLIQTYAHTSYSPTARNPNYSQ